jgi:hypothetical protein
MDNALELAHRLVDEYNNQRKENRKNSGIRCKNCKGIIRFAKNDYIEKPYCVSCYKCLGSWDFELRKDAYKEVNGKWKKVKKLS